jgi:FkbH-like protein
MRALVRNGLNSFRRAKARERLNAWLSGFIATSDVSGPRQLHLIDEAAIVRRLGSAAGRYLYQSDFQHATRLSLELASDYARRIEMLATLKGRKLVVCDLDNTLWDGVIGEGAVSHFVNRQHVLRRLKERSGVVLTIASKNDPGNVHFEGGVLALDDFVAPQINWGRKVDAVAKLRQQLNLQYRHMVFLDDRPDERAFVAEAYPEIQVIDASDPESWDRIGLWADISEGSSDLERTQLYREQLQRDALVGDDRISNLEPNLIAELELEIAVRDATRADLKRFVELINRTNQWNLTGARTSMANVQRQASDPGSLLLLASARDKFGDMGGVCAAAVSIAGDQATIDAFVLSCRVFGYGVETAMIETIYEKVAERGAKKLCGRFVATTQNQMARDMYADHGFTPEADGLFTTSLDIPPRTARAG